MDKTYFKLLQISFHPLYLHHNTQKMKKTKLSLDTKFFLISRMTEILKESADAVSTTYEQVLWNHDDGEIALDFADRTINLLGNAYHPFIIKCFLDICEHYDFELIYHTCQCENCRAERNQHN